MRQTAAQSAPPPHRSRVPPTASLPPFHLGTEAGRGPMEECEAASRPPLSQCASSRACTCSGEYTRHDIHQLASGFGYIL